MVENVPRGLLFGTVAGGTAPIGTFAMGTFPMGMLYPGTYAPYMGGIVPTGTALGCPYSGGTPYSGTFCIGTLSKPAWAV